MEIEDDRCRLRQRAEQHPLGEEQCPAGREHGRDDANGAEAREQTTRGVRGRDCEDGGGSHEIRQARDRKGGQEQPVPEGVRSDLLRDERGRGEGRENIRTALDHRTASPKPLLLMINSPFPRWTRCHIVRCSCGTLSARSMPHPSTPAGTVLP